MGVFIKDNVNLEILCKNWKENDQSYWLESPFDEYITVNKTTREVFQEGYNGLIWDWYTAGYIEERKEDKP
jgi:hypothetical protein